ncbi:hypothetical protein HAPAU_05570 [Halalkalicoccus paucihalophilus]|uniref:DUF4112 domain-containing protein n=1 Tax=Halalkalicoccus paucihalophilus TaxID=1008153 RepID=A0A151AJV8_9EURY|nr:DUF4112 domain-containing protein [Halalkalicoccus paucihalophilus]KYH27882.1 hypothetical protein HAPAU_05570 [Halalkalicoccus paucihalophilus]
MGTDTGDGDDWSDGGDDWEDGADGVGTDGFEWSVEDLPLSGDVEATLERIEWVGDLLDEAVPIPGTDYRIGLDPLLGIVPVGGDAIATVISLYIIGEAARVGVSKSTIAVMIGLVLTDAIVGSIPVLGTLFDAVWKANKWNVSLLKRELDA